MKPNYTTAALNVCRTRSRHRRLHGAIAASLLFAAVADANAQDVAMPQDALSAPVMTVERAVGDAQDRLDMAESGDSDRSLPSLLDEVVERLKFIQQNAPDHALLPYLTGRANVLAGRPREGADKLQEFIRTRDGRTNWHAYRLLGDLMVEQFPQLAKAHYDKAASLKSGDPTILYGLASAHSRLGQRDEAILYAQEAVAADRSGSVRYQSLLARLLVADEQWRKAEAAALSAVARAEAHVYDLPGSRERVVQLDNQRKLLIQVVRSWIEYGGVSPDEYFRLARYMRDRTRSAEKIAAFDILGVLELAVSKYGPDAPVPLRLEYAKSLRAVDRTDAAVAVLKSVLESDPGNSQAAEWLQRLNTAEEDSANGTVDESATDSGGS